ncbi:hypothetical protein GJAV_G00185670 [Gymnothorax javanicus]|nr:hypothetical protein GJAV_G00185670 [Gymnothorax javanicus]
MCKRLVIHEDEVWGVSLVPRDDDGVYDVSQERLSSNSSINDDQLGFACTADACPDCYTPSPKLLFRDHVYLRIMLTTTPPPELTTIISVQGPNQSSTPGKRARPPSSPWFSAASDNLKAVEGHGEFGATCVTALITKLPTAAHLIRSD